MNRRPLSSVLSASALNARLAAAKASSGKPASAGGGAHGHGHTAQPPMPVILEEGPQGNTSEDEQKKQVAAAELGDESPVCKFKDWQAVRAVAGKPAAPCAAPPAVPSRRQQHPQPAERVAAHSCQLAMVAADLDLLVQAATAGATAVAAGDHEAGICLDDCLGMLADPAVLALASDIMLAHLLRGLRPLLRYNPATRQWMAPGLAAMLVALQLACEGKVAARNSLGLAITAKCPLGRRQSSAKHLGSWDQDALAPAEGSWVSASCSRWRGAGKMPLPGYPCADATLSRLQERLSRTTLTADAGLADTASRFFSRVIRESGSVLMTDGLLGAAASYAHNQCRVLSSEVLASILSFLVTARYQPSAAFTFGSRCVERLLRLDQGNSGSTGIGASSSSSSDKGLHLKHFADVVEALAQLRCIDGLSATPVVNLAAARARQLADCGQLDAPQLMQLARVMHGIAVIAATSSTVQSATLMAATAAWHLLTMRAEALVHQAAGVGPALSRMWCASRMLMAAARATAAAPGFHLPDRLGLMSHAAWLEQEHRVASGLTSPQRRVLTALGALRVAPSKVTINSCFLDVFQISVAVRMRVKSSNSLSNIAILIRDSQTQLLRTGGGTSSASGAALGAEAALERILQADGWHVVCLDSHSCLQLPASLMAEELGSLMLGEGSSLRYAA